MEAAESRRIESQPDGGIAGGYYRANLVALYAAYLHAYGPDGPGRRRDFHFRVYLAVLLMVAVRQRADRRAGREPSSRPAAYTIAELCRLVAGRDDDAEVRKRVRGAVRFWHRSGLVRWRLDRAGTASQVDLAAGSSPADLPEIHNRPELWAAIASLAARDGTVRGAVPFPWRWMRYLAGSGVRGTIAASLAIATRAIFERGRIVLGGRIRADAVAGAFGIDADTYRRAVRRLESADVGFVKVPGDDEQRERFGPSWCDRRNAAGNWIDVEQDPVFGRPGLGDDLRGREGGKGDDLRGLSNDDRKSLRDGNYRRKVVAGGDGCRDPAGRAGRLRERYERERRRGGIDSEYARRRWVAAHWYASRKWRRGRRGAGPAIRDPVAYALSVFRGSYRIPESDYDRSESWYVESFEDAVAADMLAIRTGRNKGPYVERDVS